MPAISVVADKIRMIVPYQYREVDPYKKPADLLEINSKGLVPALKLENGRGLAESTVM